MTKKFSDTLGHKLGLVRTVGPLRLQKFVGWVPNIIKQSITLTLLIYLVMPNTILVVSLETRLTIIGVYMLLHFLWLLRYIIGADQNYAYRLLSQSLYYRFEDFISDNDLIDGVDELGSALAELQAFTVTRPTTALNSRNSGSILCDAISAFTGISKGSTYDALCKTWSLNNVDTKIERTFIWIKTTLLCIMCVIIITHNATSLWLFSTAMCVMILSLIILTLAYHDRESDIMVNSHPGTVVAYINSLRG